MPHRVFLWFAIPVGLVLIWFIPPFQSPDEHFHFYRAVHVAEGHWVGNIRGGDRVGGMLPAGVISVAEHFRRLRFDYDARTDAADISKAGAMKLRLDSLVFADFPNTGYMPPASYFPAAIAIYTGIKIGFSPLMLLYAARLATFLLWLLLMYRAIRLMPMLRWLMVFLALLPAHIALATTLNPHNLMYGVSFYLIGRAIRWAYFERGKVYRHEWWTFLTGAMFLTLNYFVYAPITAVFLLVSPRKTGGWLSFSRRIFTLIILQVALVIMWSKYTTDWFIPYDSYDTTVRDQLTMNPGVNPEAQLKFIKSDPIRFLSIEVTSIIDSAPATMAHYFTKFGWEKNYLPWPIMLLLVFGLIACMTMHPEGAYNPPPIHRLLMLSLAIACAVGLGAGIYLVWSPVGATVISNLSGRYFIPIFPLLWLSMAYPVVSHKAAQRLPSIVIGTITISHISLLFCIWERYYANN